MESGLEFNIVELVRGIGVLLTERLQCTGDETFFVLGKKALEGGWGMRKEIILLILCYLN